MGLLDDYNVNLSEIEESNFDIKDDFYEFVIGDVFVRQGTANHPDKAWVIIDFLLGDNGHSKQEWFQLPEDSDSPTGKEMKTLGRMKSRFRELGATDEMLASLDPEDFRGLTGTLEVFSGKPTANGSVFQNIRKIRVGETSASEPVVEEAPAPRAKRAPARKAPAAKPVEAPVEEEAPAEEAPEEEAAPVRRTPVRRASADAAVPARAAAAGVRKNPFA